jgi:hypothetical protein
VATIKKEGESLFDPAPLITFDIVFAIYYQAIGAMIR